MKENIKKEFPVFFSVDNSYAPYLDAALKSLKEHRSSDCVYRIYILHTGLNGKNIHRLSMNADERMTVEFADITERMKEHTLKRMNHITREALYRIVIPELYPEYDKILYMDCDIIVCDDIRGIYDTEPGDTLICAVRSLNCISGLSTHIEKNVGIPAEDYFNSGVLLFNTKKYLEENIAEKALDMYGKNAGKYIYADQDALNKVCHNRVLFLPGRWNIEWQNYSDIDKLPEEFREKCREEYASPGIIHFTTSRKPWIYPSFKNAEIFWKYARKSDYYEEMLFRNITEQALLVSARNDWLGTYAYNCFKGISFPFEKIRRGSRVIIYAAGNIGKAFYVQASAAQYCNVVLWADMNYDIYLANGLPVCGPEKIKETEYDHIIIAVEDKYAAEGIAEYLKSIGADSRRIIWQDPRSSG